jgi:cytochrome P450
MRLEAGIRWPLPYDDPYPELARLRSFGPVHWVADIDSFLVVSYDTAVAVLQSGAFSSDLTRNPSIADRFGFDGEVGGPLTRSLLFSDGADHGRLRAALRGQLTPRAVAAMRPRIQEIVTSALQLGATAEPFEVMGSFALAVPLAVVCELLDVPAEVAVLLRAEMPRIVTMLDPLAEREVVEEGVSAAVGIMLALVPIVADRRKGSGDDLLSALVGHGSGLEVDEAITMALLLLAAGHETTSSLVGNAVVALHDHPVVARYLRRHPGAIPSAIEELLRYDSPVQMTARLATSNQRLGALEIPTKAQVLVSTAAANHDPNVFEHPDDLRLDRTAGPHLAFGHGAHFCAGASLARLEADEMLRQILALDPPVEEREMRVERGRSVSLRRLENLELR